MCHYLISLHKETWDDWCFDNDMSDASIAAVELRGRCAYRE